MSYHGGVADKSLRFARNFSWSMMGQAGAGLINFLLLPFVVHGLGIEAYGLYILMHTVATYLQLFALGAGSTVVRYVPSFNASRSYGAMRRLLGFSLATHGLGVLVGALLLVAGIRPIAVRVLRVPEPLLDLAGYVLLCAAAGGLFSSLTQFSLAILHGLQRFKAHSSILFLQSSLTAMGAAACVAGGRGLRAVACLYVAVNALLCVAAALLVRRNLTLGRETGPERLTLRMFARWSVSMWLGSFAGMVVNQFDKILLAQVMSLSAVTLYAVPSGLLQRLQALPSVVSSVVLPMMSELQGPGSDEAMRRMYLKSLRLILWLTLPVLILLFAFMPQFLGLWLKTGGFSDRGVWPSRLLVVAQLFFALMSMANAAAFSRDKPTYVTGLVWAQAGVSLVAWRLLAPRFGLIGVALGTLAAQAIPALFYAAKVHRLLGLPLGRFIAEGLRAPAISGALTLAAVFPFHDLATTWFRLGLLSALGGALFYGSTWLMLGQEDRDLLERVKIRLGFPGPARTQPG